MGGGGGKRRGGRINVVDQRLGETEQENPHENQHEREDDHPVASQHPVAAYTKEFQRSALANRANSTHEADQNSQDREHQSSLNTGVNIEIHGMMRLTQFFCRHRVTQFA